MADERSRDALLEELQQLRIDGRWQQVMLRVRRATARVRRPEDLDETLVVIRECLESMGLPYQGCGVNLIDVQNPTRPAVSYHRMTAGQTWSPALPEPGGVIQRIWERGEVAYRRDLEAKDPFGERDALAAIYGFPVRAVVDIPFSHGTLALNSSSANPFSDRDLRFLGEIAHGLSRCFQRMDEIRTLEERNRELEREIAARGQVEARLSERDRLVMAFHDIGQTILSTLDSETILDAMGVQIAEAGIFRSLMIALVDSSRNQIEVVRTFYRTPEGSLLRNPSQAIGIHYDLEDDNITAEVARTGQMRIIDEWDQRFDERVDSAEDRQGKVSYFIPVTQRGRVVAVLATGSQRDEKEAVIARIEAMVPLLNQMAIALEHARLYEEAQQEIRERRRAEQERSELAARLQRVEKMELVGTLAGGVAHDLNNILSGIVGYPELMLIDLPEDSILRKPLLAIRRAGERAATIVQDLLTLARRGVSTDEVVRLNDIVSEYIASPEYEDLARRHPGIEVEVALAGDLLDILGSPVHLGKTLMNLVINAMEAMESMESGGTLTVTTQNRYLDHPVRGYDEVADGDYAVVQVADTGIGMAPEDMQRIFEPFYTKKQMGRSGTGLGMAVVWSTVKDHQGYIDLESTPGEGTTFTLYFPVTCLQASTQSPQGPAEYAGRGESILVIDDVEEQRDLAAAILRRLGYEVAVAASGEEAVERLSREPVDLLVLDMIMEGGMDGLDTYRQVRRLRREQRAILASGFSETDRVRQAQELGASAFVKKPYLIENLGLAVRQALDA